MNDKDKKICPKCYSKLHKNGKRNNNQRWRCSTHNCNYSCTESKYITKPKQRAINFFYDLISSINEKVGEDILKADEHLAKTSIDCKKDIEVEVSKICREEKLDIKENYTQTGIDNNKNIGVEVNAININKMPKEIPAMSYLLYIADNKINLLNLRYANQGIKLNYKSKPARFELENSENV